tara:strand:- start:151 stop:1116 length:966 start_codon:yes stop_codon:yes gene_type:complete
MNEFKIARDLGASWLESQIQNNGIIGDSIAGVTAYYKVPAALQVCGKTQQANRMIDWIRDFGLETNGDFGPRPKDELKNYWYTYYNSWVVVGSQRLGQFDVAQKGMNFIKRFWDKESGGFFSDVEKKDKNTYQDLWVVAGNGIAAIYTGELEIAKSVGNWMQKLMDLQPEYPEKLYSVFNKSEGLITEFKDDDIRFVMSANAERDQFFFHPGIAAGFLSRLYLHTNEKKWLELAKLYMLIAEKSSDYLWHTLRAGKVAWGNALLYRITKEKKYYDMAIRAGKNIISQQTKLGYWGMEEMSSIDATAELVYWLDEVYQVTKN